RYAGCLARNLRRPGDDRVLARPRPLLNCVVPLLHHLLAASIHHLSLRWSCVTTFDIFRAVDIAEKMAKRPPWGGFPPGGGRKTNEDDERHFSGTVAGAGDRLLVTGDDSVRQCGSGSS